MTQTYGGSFSFNSKMFCKIFQMLAIFKTIRMLNQPEYFFSSRLLSFFFESKVFSLSSRSFYVNECDSINVCRAALFDKHYLHALWYFMSGLSLHKLANGFYSDGPFQLEATFQNIRPNSEVINAKLSPIKLNWSFKNIYVFLFLN